MRVVATLATNEAWAEGVITLFFVALGAAALRWQPPQWRGWLVFCGLFVLLAGTLTVLAALGHTFYGL